MASPDYFSLFGFQSEPTKVIEVIILQLLQMYNHGQSRYYFLLLLLLLYVMNLCFIVIKYFLF
jgi:hypothetical protein